MDYYARIPDLRRVFRQHNQAFITIKAIEKVAKEGESQANRILAKLSALIGDNLGVANSNCQHSLYTFTSNAKQSATYLIMTMTLPSLFA